jgi:hypothetical protein
VTSAAPGIGLVDLTGDPRRLRRERAFRWFFLAAGVGAAMPAPNPRYRAE